MKASFDKKPGKRLGETLIEEGLIDETKLAVALGMQKRTGLKLGAQLLQLGFIQESDLSGVLRQMLGIEISLSDMAIPYGALKAVPKKLAFKYKVMPVSADPKGITIATANPSDLDSLDELSFQLGKKIKTVRALEWDIDNALIKNYLDFSDDEMDRLTTTSKAAEQYKNVDRDFGHLNVLDVEPAGSRIVSGGPMPGLEVTAQSHIEKKVEAAEEPLSSLKNPQRQPIAQPRKTMPSPVPRPPISGPLPKRPVQPGPPEQTLSASAFTGKANLHHALIELLIQKGLITEKELLDTLVKLERNMPE